MGKEAFAEIARMAQLAEDRVTAGMDFVSEANRPKAPCNNCGKLVVAGARSCQSCGFSGFHWTCNNCSAVLIHTKIGLMFCNRCNAFWREEQSYALQDVSQQQRFTQIPNDSRTRGTCPACLEMMLVGASTCPYCHTTDITWPGLTNPQPKNHKKGCFSCNGTVALKGGRHVYCTVCGMQLPGLEYPHLFK